MGAILDACDTIVYMGGGRSKESRAYISESLGTQTVYEHTVSETVSADHGQQRFRSVVVPVARPPAARRGRGRQDTAGAVHRPLRAAPLMVGKYRTQDTDEYKDSPFAPDRRARPSQGPSLCRR
ncbi:MAG: TraM recognition domain-containing protein [Collinsella sp.]